MGSRLCSTGLEKAPHSSLNTELVVVMMVIMMVIMMVLTLRKAYRQMDIQLVSSFSTTVSVLPPGREERRV